MCSQNEAQPAPKQNAPAAIAKKPPQKGEEKPMDTTGKWIAFQTTEGILFVIKAADSHHHPKGEYLGKKEFEGQAAGEPGERYLLHILIPNAIAGTQMTYKAEGVTRPLEEPRMVFRMPNSPRYTSCMVSVAAPGRLEILRAGKSLGSLNLADVSAKLAALPLHWNEKSGTVSYQGMPASLDGKMPL